MAGNPTSQRIIRPDGSIRARGWSAGLYGQLRQHRAIAWDVDYTLYGHPASPNLHAFIVAHPDIRHVVVTFRSHGEEDEVWDELAEYPHAPAEACFDGVLNISDEAHVDYHDASGRRARLQHADPLSPAELHYLEWKGWTCAQNGLTLLVDDMTALVTRGCEKHGIELLHPDQFL